jgi:hypothetical protein
MQCLDYLDRWLGSFLFLDRYLVWLQQHYCFSCSSNHHHDRHHRRQH